MIHSLLFPLRWGTRLGVTFSIMIRSDKVLGNIHHSVLLNFRSIMNPAVTLPKSATLTKEVRLFLSSTITRANS